MTTVPDRSTFEAMYAGKAPWDIGRPQQPFLDAADRITGSVLDAGCGTGDTALYFAGGADCPLLRRAGLPGHSHRLSRSADPASTTKGGGAGRAGDIPGQRRPDAQGLERAVRQRDRQRVVSRL